MIEKIRILCNKILVKIRTLFSALSKNSTKSLYSEQCSIRMSSGPTVLPQNSLEGERSQLGGQGCSHRGEEIILQADRHDRDQRNNKEPKPCVNECGWQCIPKINVTKGHCDHQRIDVLKGQGSRNLQYLWRISHRTPDKACHSLQKNISGSGGSTFKRSDNILAAAILPTRYCHRSSRLISTMRVKR